MRFLKQAFRLGSIAIMVFILCTGCSSREDEEDKSVLKKIVTIDEKLKELNGEIIKDKTIDLNGDGEEERLYLVKTTGEEMFLLVDNHKEIVENKISKDTSSFSSFLDINSDNTLDIFLIGNKDNEVFVEIFTSKDEGYTSCKIEEEEMKKGVDLNFSIFTFENNSKKGVRSYLNEEGKKLLIENKYIDKMGNIHNPNIPLVIKNNSIELNDANYDGITDLIIGVKIGLDNGENLVNQYKIYNYDIIKDSYKLTSIVNKLSDFKVSESLNINEVRELIYSKTKVDKAVIDYSYGENIENIPSEIKDKYYTFFEIYKTNNGGMASDYLILVNKDDNSMYRYYVDGLILPL